MKYSRHNPVIPMILLTGIIYSYWNYVRYVLIVVILIFVVRLVVKLMRKLRIAVCNTRLRDIDTMDGTTFEQYVAQLLINHGYTYVSLTEKYDYGVDIIAHKDGVRWGVQVKRYSGLVKADAVRQVVAGLRLYDCDRAMVVTNSTYSVVAQKLAAGNDCVLIDRKNLQQLLSIKMLR